MSALAILGVLAIMGLPAVGFVLERFDVVSFSRVQRRWPRLAAGMGFAFAPGGDGAAPTLTGKRRGRSVRIVAVDDGREALTVFEVQLDRVTPALTVSRAEPGARGVVPTGDVTFDQAVQLHGPAPWVSVVIDPVVRALLTRLVVRLGGGIANHRIAAAVPGLLVEAAGLDEVLNPLLDIAQALHVSTEEAQRRLVQRVRSDAGTATRAEALRLLLLPGQAQTMETHVALQVALADPDAALRLAAAKLAGDEGVATLQALVRAPAADVAPRILALEALSVRTPYPQLVPVLRAALTSDADALRAAALDRVVAQRDAGQLEEVWLALELGGALTVPAAIRAMALGPHPRSERELVRLLAHDDAEIRNAAVAALGQMGTPAALPALDALHSLDPRLLLAARQAKQQIRERTP